jgi:hypothetical protein
MPRSPDIPYSPDLFGVIQDLRKPHAKTDTGLVVVGNYIGFGDPGNDPGTDEMSPPFLNGWENITGMTSGFRLNEIGKIEISAAVKNGTIGDPVWILPVDYRRPYDVRFVQATTSTSLSIVEVKSTGQVIIVREFTV